MLRIAHEVSDLMKKKLLLEMAQTWLLRRTWAVGRWPGAGGLDHSTRRRDVCAQAGTEAPQRPHDRARACVVPARSSAHGLSWFDGHSVPAIR